MIWWLWILVGFGLLVLEMLTPGVFFLFFAVSALLVGIVVGAGMDMPVWGELLAFSVLSIVLLLVFRGPILRKMKGRPGEGRRVDRLEDEIATTQEAISVGAVGKAELRGTTWSARNMGTIDLDAGVRCQVERVDGLTLCIRKPDEKESTDPAV